MPFAKLGSEIMRDYTTDGVPASGANPVSKADMRAWMAAVEADAELIAEMAIGLESVNADATTELGDVAAKSVTIVGALSITSFGSSAPTGDIRFLLFAGPPLVTHNATSLILPGAVDIQMAAGDALIVRHEGSGNWRALALLRGSGELGLGRDPSEAWLHTAAGSATRAPVKKTAGINLTSPSAGAEEFDGKVFYKTPTDANRGVDLAEHFTCLIADATGSNVNTAQQVFPTNGVLTLPGNTTFEFEAEYVITRAAGTTSHTTAVLFGGTATFTSLRYVADVINPTGNVLAAVQRIFSTVATALTLTAANTSATENLVIRLSGVFRTNAAGTIIPQFQYSAAPGGAPTILANSFFRCRPLGVDTVAAVGNWS